MKADGRVLLDACVLIPMPLADTLLRMAESPRLYLPQWSPAILEEVSRNLVAKWGMAPEKAAHREREILRHFPEACVEGFEPLIGMVANDPGDRHVLAAAVKSKCESIVTYNRRHFRPAALRPWGIQAKGPSTFLRELYDLAPGLFAHKLDEQAQAIGMPMERLLGSLAKNVPGFVGFFCEKQGIRRP